MENQQPGMQPQMNYVSADQHDIDPMGNVTKNGVLTICMFAERLAAPGAVQGIAGASSNQPLKFNTFPCTLRCPKANLVRVEDPSKGNELVGRLLQISCNGTVDQFELPKTEEKQQDKKPGGMTVV